MNPCRSYFTPPLLCSPLGDATPISISARCSLCPHLAAVDATTTLSGAMPRSLLLLLHLVHGTSTFAVAVGDADLNLRAVLDLTGDALCATPI